MANFFLKNWSNFLVLSVFNFKFCTHFLYEDGVRFTCNFMVLMCQSRSPCHLFSVFQTNKQYNFYKKSM